MKSKFWIQFLSIVAAIMCFATFAMAQTPETTNKGNFFNPENLITVIVGGAASLGVTHYIKNWTGAYGAVALVLAIIVAFVIGFIAMIVSTLFSGEPFDWASMPSKALQLFALATVAYKLLLADTA